MSDRISIPSVSVTYAQDGSSTKSNLLGMRPMQERVWLKRGEQYLLIKSPPASGKSRALMFIALDKLQNQKLKQAIIVVPEKTIGASFHDEPLSQFGFWADWKVEPRWNLCNAPGGDNGGKVDAVRKFLDGADKGCDKILVCTHATFRFAVEKFGVEAFDDRLIAVDEFHHVSANPDSRLRVIYDNGTESDLLARSLQRALYKDDAGRRIVESGPGPLFSDAEEEGDLTAGYIYVLRSKSDHPFVAQNRDVIHKIGVTRGDVKSRVANARKDPTYLLADVEIVATFKLANLSGGAFEALLHKFFGNARLDLELKDRFGAQVEPREWFLVPLPVIDEAIRKIMEGTIDRYRYDRETASLTRE